MIYNILYIERGQYMKDNNEEYMSYQDLQLQNLRKGIGRKVKKFREELGMTQNQLGERADLTQNYISTIESGQVNLTVESLFRLATALKVDVMDFFHVFTDKRIGQYEWAEVGDEAELMSLNFLERRRLRTFYPELDNDIKSLLALVVYLPLIDPASILDALLETEIADGTMGKEEYIVEFLSELVRKLDDVPAKRFADKLYSEICVRREKYDIRYEMDPSERYDDEYIAYLNTIQTKKRLLEEYKRFSLCLLSGEAILGNFSDWEIDNEKRGISQEDENRKRMETMLGVSNESG